MRTDVTAIDLTGVADLVKTDTDTIQVSAAPGADGIVRRMQQPAREGSTNWAVFALANSGDEQIDRLIVVPHYRMVGSGLFLPDLGLSRIVTISPSSGERPEQQYSATADIYRITLDPGTVVTYIAELRTDRLPQLYLWEPDAYKDKINSFTLYYGIVIGIAGLLALFLTILFVVKGSVMFPAAAALGWAVLVYIGIDFGFWGKVFDMSSGAERIWRASGEAILAGTLLVFLFAYLNLGRWHVRYMHITLGWLAGLAALVAIALIDASIASGIARLSLRADRVSRPGPRDLSLHPRLRPRGAADPDLVPAGGLDGRPDDDGDRLRHQRHHRPGAARRPGADRHADRLHRDAARLRRRHHPQHRHRRRAARAGADRRGRHDLGLGRVGGPRLHQPGDRAAPRPQARRARRPGVALARRAARARPRPLPRGARRRAGAAPRPADAGFPPAHAGWSLPVVRAEGAARGRLRRRGGAAGRHADRRDRIQDRRGASAARRGARQPHRPAEPAALHRPARSRAGLRQVRSEHPRRPWW